MPPKHGPIHRIKPDLVVRRAIIWQKCEARRSLLAKKKLARIARTAMIAVNKKSRAAAKGRVAAARAARIVKKAKEQKYLQLLQVT